MFLRKVFKKMMSSSLVPENSSYSVKINLIEDLQCIAKNILIDYGYEIGESFGDDWIRALFNVQKQLVSTLPRKIVKSKEFECPENYMKALNEIENRIKSGQSLTKFMSNKILKLGNKDLMLYDWNIHHLHLSRRERDDGFVKRSDYELFVFFTNEVAYFIQIYPHNYSYLYSTKDMVEIVHNNWPELISKYKINGVLSCKITNEQRELLRKAGITIPVETQDGVMYVMMGGGYASDGSSIEVTRATSYWKTMVSQYQKIVESEVNGIVNAIRKVINTEVQTCLNFKLHYIDSNEVVLFEKSNQVYIKLFQGNAFYQVYLPCDCYCE